MMIILPTGKSTQIEECILLSPADADLTDLHWTRTTKLSFFASINHKRVQLHCVIMERKLNRPLKDDEQVDHIDRNRYNNQRENLRLATHAQNMQNKIQRKRSSKYGPYRGVCKQSGGWTARIDHDKKIEYLGFFHVAEDAARAYNAAALKYHGEFAVLNQIPG